MHRYLLLHLCIFIVIFNQLVEIESNDAIKLLNNIDYIFFDI